MSKSNDPMSYEDLGAVYRVEKKSPTLSAVRKDLYPAMAGVVVSLRAEYERHLSADPDSIICEGVNLKRKKAMSLSKEVAEIRMGKIAALALIGARGGQNVLDHLTPEERDYYNEILGVSGKHLDLMDRLSGKRRYDTPEIDSAPVAKKAPAPAPAPAEEWPDADLMDEPPPEPEDEAHDEPMPEPPAEPAVAPAKEETAAETPEPVPEAADEDEAVVIRILEDLPPFSGPDRNYELSKEDVVRMPRAMAAALINRDKAELISPSP